jgi:ribosome recycling factor
MDITQNLKDQIGKILEIIKADIGAIRTGRATPALVENLSVMVYGGSAKMKVLEVATIGTLDTQTLVITPFDHSIIHEIEKGIRESNTGLSPVVDGTVIRISLPPLSQERREELIKLMHQKLENGKVMIRQARHETMEEIKKNSDGMSEDETERLEKEAQKMIDDAILIVENIGKQKSDELMQI